MAVAVEFEQWLRHDFPASWPRFDWNALGDPASVGILVIDMVRGFCDLGPLASPRVAALVNPIADWVRQARDSGVSNIWFACDEHPADSAEFASFPPHCVAGSEESELMPALRGLGKRVPKASLNALLNSSLLAEIEANSQLRHFVLVGDCTDLCVSAAAMHLRLLANQRALPWTVWVLADLVDTYDLPVDAALSVGALPHPADACHLWGLYQLALNGCRVART